MLISLGGALVATVATAAIPLVQRQIIDNVIVTHKQSIWPLAGVLLLTMSKSLEAATRIAANPGQAPESAATFGR